MKGRKNSFEAVTTTPNCMVTTVPNSQNETKTAVSVENGSSRFDGGISGFIGGLEARGF
jgi:hypothetical protein